MAGPILHAEVPPEQRARAAARLPSMVPVAEAGWLRADDRLAAQVALKRSLVATRRREVIAVTPEGIEAAADCLDRVTGWLLDHGGARREGAAIRRPGLPPVTVDRDDPLGTLAGLVAEDLCLLRRIGDEHVLVAALLGFPSGWTLSEKIGKPMRRIHAPVDEYDDGIGTRVQRMFDNLPPGRILGRANLNPADSADLFHPLSEDRPAAPPPPRLYDRSEWQTISRLPRSGSLLFTIHVTLAPAAG